MKEEVKIVARTKTGEMIKGYLVKTDIKRFRKGEPAYLRFAFPENTVGTMINQDQLSAMFEVKTFEGKKPVFIKQIYFGIVRILKTHAPVVLAATIMAFLSLVGLITLF